VRARVRAGRQARLVIQTWGLCVSATTTSSGDARHRDAAYRQREVWECSRLCLSSLAPAISLLRRARDTSASSPPPPLSHSSIGASLIQFFSFFSQSPLARRQLLSPLGITRETRERLLPSDRHSLSSINLVRGCRAGTPRRPAPSDRILNRDDLDDAFEAPTGNTFARLFTARQSYLVLELILGASDVGNKVPHPERRTIGLPAELGASLRVARIYILHLMEEKIKALM